ncbi:MAG: hypothetical protein JO261_14790, partial [Alphaproteobacteria bacterium]|nr:hypothetical protein [Alphaproteobacteria bacterium]
MKSVLKAAAAAAVFSAFAASVPAQAGVDIGISFGIPVVPGAVGIDYDSGGYCDDYGCPDAYWDMP